MDLRSLPQRNTGLSGSGSGRSILVTGCSSGIGLASAEHLRRRGWLVLATCRAETDAARLSEAGFESFALDYADAASVAAGAERALDLSGGHIDAVFNNGAFACPGAVEDLPRGALEEIFATNLFGVHDLTVRLLPAMRAGGRGRVVNCSSVLGFVAAPWRGAYVATKFALEGLSDTLRLEMRGTGIDVVLIEPGPIATSFRKNSIPHFERWVDWERSPRADQYRRSLLKRLYEGRTDRFQLPPLSVAQVLERALLARRPRARYRVTVPTRLARAMALLPTPLADRLLLRG